MIPLPSRRPKNPKTKIKRERKRREWKQENWIETLCLQYVLLRLLLLLLLQLHTNVNIRVAWYQLLVWLNHHMHIHIHTYTHMHILYIHMFITYAICVCTYSQSLHKCALPMSHTRLLHTLIIVHSFAPLLSLSPSRSFSRSTLIHSSFVTFSISFYRLYFNVYTCTLCVHALLPHFSLQRYCCEHPSWRSGKGVRFRVSI